MKLLRDLMIVDYESFEPEVERAVLIKISHILLDKDNLLVKQAKDIFIKHSWLASTIDQHARAVGVAPEVITSGQKPLEAARALEKDWGGNFTLAVPNLLKYSGLRYFFRRQSLGFPINETQVLDLHTIYQLFALRSGWHKSPSLPSLAEFFGKRLSKVYDPSERVKLHAEVLTKILATF